MDTVTFELAPLEVRIRAIAVLAVSVGLQLLAASLLSKANIELSGTGHFVAAALLFIFGLGLCARLVFASVATFMGRPHVRRGLFRSKMVVAWKSHLRAQVFTAFVTLLAVYTALDARLRTGGIVFVLAAIVAHVGLYLIARDRRLAAVHLWAAPMAAAEPEPVKAPARVLRPMIDSPLPPPPRIGDDPYRVPSPAARLEDKLVKPALVTATPEVVPSGNADEPSFLR